MDPPAGLGSLGVTRFASPKGGQQPERPACQDQRRRRPRGRGSWKDFARDTRKHLRDAGMSAIAISTISSRKFSDSASWVPQASHLSVGSALSRKGRGRLPSSCCHRDHFRSERLASFQAVVEILPAAIRSSAYAHMT